MTNIVASQQQQQQEEAGTLWHNINNNNGKSNTVDIDDGNGVLNIKPSLLLLLLKWAE